MYHVEWSKKKFSSWLFPVPPNNTAQLLIIMYTVSKSAYLLYIGYLGPRVYQNPPVPTFRVSGLAGLAWAWELVFLESNEKMLVLLVSDLKDTFPSAAV